MIGQGALKNVNWLRKITNRRRGENTLRHNKDVLKNRRYWNAFLFLLDIITL